MALRDKGHPTKARNEGHTPKTQNEEHLPKTRNRARPLVSLTINGKTLLAMIDTGSEATLLKSSTTDIQLPRRREPTHQLSGVEGSSVEVLGDYDLPVTLSPGKNFIHRVALASGIDFPADLLIGMDFLHRFTFHLASDRHLNKSFLKLDECYLPVTYTDAPSLNIHVVGRKLQVSNVQRYTPSEVGQDPIPEDQDAHAFRTSVVPPRAGKFIKVKVPAALQNAKDIMVVGTIKRVLVPCSVVSVTQGYIPVWVLNPCGKTVKIRCGTHLGVLYDVTAKDEHSTCAVYSNMPPPEPSSEDVPDNLPPLDHLRGKDRQNIDRLLRMFPRLFSSDTMECGEIPGVTHKIKTGDAAPTVTRQWRLPFASRQAIREQCESMWKAGIIEPSNSPWLSPVVLVRKKTGDVRFCVDFRKINALTAADSHPLPPIQNMLDDLHASKVFSSLDARSAYWSIPVEPSDRPKTAFSDGGRLFQFVRMPYGLKTAPQTFQRTINLVLSSVLGRHTAAYLDDIVIFSNNMEEHQKHLQETLTLLHQAGLRLNPEKCKIAVKEFKFLGFIVSAEGIRPDPDKVRAIADMEAPKDVRAVRRFLGSVGFFRRHVPNFAGIAAPLTNLTRKDTPFVWTKTHQEAFEDLKMKLMSMPVLRNPDYSRPFEVHTDASQIAIGACLMQRSEDCTPHAVAYYSCKMKGPEVRYSATDSEALAVVEAVRAFDPYVYGRNFTIFTDHRPLVYIFKRRTKSPRMSRWGLELQTYDYTIQYRQGSTNKVPDMVSRASSAVGAISLEKIDPSVLRQEQLKDAVWAEVIGYLEGGKLPKSRTSSPLDEFEVSEGILYHVKPLPDRILKRVVVPRQLYASALRLAHNSPLATHPGIFRTYSKLKGMFYFSNMLSQTKKYVKQCDTCQRRKGPATRNALLASPPEVSRPLEKVSADLITLPLTSKRNKYVLVLVDNLSRYVELIALRNRTAETVARAIVDKFITVYGPPLYLQTDGGGEFDNDLLHDVCTALNTDFRLTIAYNPQSNGVVERTNRVVKEALTALCASTPSQWDEVLPQVRFALNTSVHRSVVDQPIYLFQGRHVDLPVGLTNHPEYSDDTPAVLRERLSLAWDAAKEATRKAREKWTTDYNKKVRRKLELKEGTLVLLKTAVRSNALSPRWYGPARIEKKLGPVSFLVRELYDTAPARKIHANQLKIFYPSDELTTPHDPVDPDDAPQDSDDLFCVALLSALG